MGKKDARVDAYIKKSADFAKPILNLLRKAVHEACPEVQETIKWGFPAFEYKGPLCGMAGFKAHCTFMLWKHSIIIDKAAAAGEAMGHFGRITSIKDLPNSRTLSGYIKKAVKLNDDGIKLPARKSKPKSPIKVPEILAAALRKNKRANATFDGFSYSHKKEYVEWLTEAKSEETRERRLATAIEWMEEGKSRHWKYMKKK
jgi:uncharacterized protein YdeI (YjbR/CyaY-like superfamily)